ncbi:MAG: superoxide dismutase family protein [Gammaproteobacteria bacterium]|nr:superoxide dismutase family protein [Gammaproteobacteria bacterium]
MRTRDKSYTAVGLRRGAPAEPTLRAVTALIAASGIALVLAGEASGQQAEGSQSSEPADGDSGLAANAPRPTALARAVLEPTEGHAASGRVEFVETADGVAVEARLTGLTPGAHGIHVHENGDCSAPDASSAGDHLAPQGSPHGAPDDPRAQRHAGDLGNIEAADSGEASMRMTDRVLELDDGEQGVVGRAVVVHAAEDDLTTQPSGNSGDPVACGVIELVESGRG